MVVKVTLRQAGKSEDENERLRDVHSLTSGAKPLTPEEHSANYSSRGKKSPLRAAYALHSAWRLMRWSLFNIKGRNKNVHTLPTIAHELALDET